MSTSSRRDTSILVVDDDVDLRESLREILELEGYGVALAEHGRDALELLHSGYRPQLILLDLMMPVMDGVEFLTQLRAEAEFANLPVFVVTAFADFAKGLAAQRVLPKPLCIPSFLGLIAERLEAP